MQPPSGSLRQRRRWPRLFCVLAVVCVGFAGAPSALADTHLSDGTHLSSNTTWTTANSPYILDGSATVNSGVTLTINAGVTVKLAGGHFAELTINGTLTVSGTSGSHVTITSGQATPAAGDWYDLHVNGSATFTYADIYYGGYGSADWAYAAVAVDNSGSVSLDHTVIEYADRSGLLVGYGGTSPSGSASVSDSTLSNNHTGIYVNNGYLATTGDEISDNTRDGVALSYTSAYTGTASDVSGNDITGNGRYGVYYQPGSGFVGTAYEPTGHENNIYGNSDYQYYGLQQEPTLDWTNNYWGATMYTYTNPEICLSYYPTAYTHIQSTPGALADGPVYWEEQDIVVVINDVPVTFKCGIDSAAAISFSNYPF